MRVPISGLSNSVWCGKHSELNEYQHVMALNIHLAASYELTKFRAVVALDTSLAVMNILSSMIRSNELRISKKREYYRKYFYLL